MKPIDLRGFKKNLDKNTFKGLYVQEWNNSNSKKDQFNGANRDHVSQLNSDWKTYSINLPDIDDDDDGDGNKKKTESGTDKLKKFLGGGLNFLEKGITTQEERDYLPSKDAEMTNAADLLGKMTDSQGKLNDLSVIGKNLIEGIFGQLELYYEQQTGLIDRVNKQAGLTGDLAKNFREELTNANPRLLQLGIGFDDLSQAAVTLVENSGKFNVINQQTFERAGEVATAYVGTLEKLVQMYPEFEKVGVGASDAQESIARAGQESIGLGLRAQNVTRDLSKNIGKLNEYGFKNGIDGLSSMVRKANEFRMSMESVFQIADKVMNPEGAIELAANLQALGGAIGDFNDPMKLMYMATNNVEGLQDALIGAASSLTTYNTEQKRFEITGVNIRRAKEMATQMGISYQELTNGAIASAERMSALDDMAARGLTVNAEQKEFITNLAQMKDGKMSIEIGSSEKLKEIFKKDTVKLEELTQEQLTQLVKYQDDLKKMDADDIARQQVTSVMNLERDANYILALLRVQAGRTVDKLANQVYEKSGMSPEKLAEKTRDYTKNTDGIRDISNNVSNSVKEAFAKNNTKKTSDKTSDTKSQTSPVKESKKTPDVLPVKSRVYDNGDPVDVNKKSLVNNNDKSITINQSQYDNLMAKVGNRNIDSNNSDQSVLIKNKKLSVELNSEQLAILVPPKKPETNPSVKTETKIPITTPKTDVDEKQNNLVKTDIPKSDTENLPQKEIIYVNVDKKQEIELLNTILTKLNESNNKTNTTDNSFVTNRQIPIETKESQESNYINAGFRSIDTNFKLLYDLYSKKSNSPNEETAKKEKSPFINVNLTKQDTDSEKILLFVKILSDLVSEKNKEQKTPNLKEITQKDISDIEVFKLLNQGFIEFQKFFVKNGEQKLTGEDEINRNKKISDSFIQAINVIDKIKIEDVGRFTESFFEGIKNYFGKEQKTNPTEPPKTLITKVETPKKDETYSEMFKSADQNFGDLQDVYIDGLKNINNGTSEILLNFYEASKYYQSLKTEQEKSNVPIVNVETNTIENKSSDNNRGVTTGLPETKIVPKETPVESAKEITSTIIHKHVVEMRIMSQGPIVDKIARVLYNDSSFVEGLINPNSREFTSSTPT